MLDATTWKCPDCLVVTNEETMLSNMLGKLKDELKQEIGEMIDKNATRMIEVSQKQVMEVIRTQGNNLNEKVEATKEELLKRIEALERKDKMNQGRMEEIERRNDVIVANVPIVANKKDHEILRTLMQLCKADIGDVEKSFRLKGNQAEGGKPTGIVIRFSSNGAKERFMDGFFELLKTKKTLTADMLGFKVKERVFINGYLKSALKPVFTEAMKLKKERKLQAVNSRFNVVRVKKDGKWIALQSIEELRKIMSLPVRMES